MNIRGIRKIIRGLVLDNGCWREERKLKGGNYYWGEFWDWVGVCVNVVRLRV